MDNNYMICHRCGQKFYEKYSKWSNGKFCSKKCARSYATLKKRKEINEKVSKKILEVVKEKGDNYSWNKGKSSVEKKICPICKKKFKPRLKTQTYCSMVCVKKDTNGLYMKKRGGYRKGSGRCVGGYYKNIYCHSTYELAFIIWNLDNDIYPIPCDKVFKYTYNNEEHKYFPDFEINDVIYEIKGYWTKIVDIKMESVKKAGYEIKILYYKDIKKYINYSIKKYNVSNMKELYEDYIPDIGICQYCGEKFQKKKGTKGMFCSRKCAGKNLQQKHLSSNGQDTRPSI